jgi:hypothetical protein
MVEESYQEEDGMHLMDKMGKPYYLRNIYAKNLNLMMNFNPLTCFYELTHGENCLAL